ncbi:uncharacterized protein LOC132164320 [Corylus avellana]|uniref:uncharacterized protein LOC132164320 n=1 Tax=Corylus avellana TaxID=13451 RepID=UPI00286BC4AD|nr:uncharacterized protein LOC132164320 [Corylus avellana]
MLQSILVPLSVHVLGTLRANDCTSLERILTLTDEGFGSFFLDNCHKLVEIRSLKSLQSAARLHMRGCNNLSPAFRESVLQMMCEVGSGSIFLPGSEIPNWFSHQTNEGCSICLPRREIRSYFVPTVGWWSYQTMASLISFRVPSFWDGKIGKMLLCVVFAANKETPRDLSRVCNFKWSLRNKTRTNQMDFSIGSPPARFFGSCEDHIFVQGTGDHQMFGLEMKSGDEIEVSVAFESLSMDRSEELKGEIQVKKCGIHLPVNEPSVMDTSVEFSVCELGFPIYAGYNELI